MYWGMYVQRNLVLMYMAIAIGMAAWLGLLLRLPDDASQ